MRKPDSINPILLYYLGRRVRTLREAREPNQEVFANEHGYDRNLWGRIERGLQNVSASSLSKVAAALGVTMSSLLDGLEEEVRRDPERTARLAARSKPAGVAAKQVANTTATGGD